MMRNKRKPLTVLYIAIFIIGIAFLYLALPGGKLHRQYVNEVQLYFNEIPQQTAFFTQEAIAGLPVPLQKYISHCGYMGKPLMSHAYIDFTEARFSLSQGQRPITIHYEQHNFVSRPDRHAFIDVRKFGVHVMNGKDTLINGTGSMTIVLAKHITLGQSVGREMSQSQLVTVLADSVLMPSLFLQDYVKWTYLDDTHAECTITWDDLTASGIFTFNGEGEIIRFDTNDRYLDNNGENSNLPWTVEYGSYHEVDGFRRPGTLKSYWHMRDGSEYTYFESDNYSVY
jgi:hypothetical protein